MKVVCDFSKTPMLSMQSGGFETLTCFLPIMGKPFLQHVLDSVARLGATELVIYVSEHADQFERFIGDGERWGFSTAYHLMKKDSSVAERVLRSVWLESEEPFLFCNNIFQPCLETSHLQEFSRFIIDDGTGTGWFYGTKAYLSPTATNSLGAVVLDALCVESPQQYLASMERVFSLKGGPLVVMGKELREGVWVGPGSRIHPSCTITAPVYIGARVNLGAQTVIGPRAEIDDGCIVDDGSTVIESSVLAGSYIGKHLEVRGCVVNQNTIFNVELDTAYIATDDLLASSVEQEDDSENRMRVPFPSRFVALLLGIVTSPLLLLVLAINRIVHHRHIEKLAMVEMRQASNQNIARQLKTVTIHILRHRSEIKRGVRTHAVWILLPGLWHVVRGKSRFFGIPYRTEKDFANLSKEWRGLYEKSYPGLITEADILYDEYPEEEMLFASEMYYHVVDSFRYNAKLFFRYVGALFGRKGS